MKVIKKFEFDDIKGFKFGSWPFGYPKLFVHVYYIEGLLIDTGQSNMRDDILKSVSKFDIDQIFLTHHHEDHTGNLSSLQKYYDCPTYASSSCCDIMKDPPGISIAQKLTWGKTKPNFEIKIASKVIETKNYTFNSIPIPGHAIDMVGLYEANKGWFFSADLFVNEYIKFFKRDESMAEQIISIQKTLELDFDVLLCSHNPKLKNGKEHLRQKLQFLQDFYGIVSTLYHQGYSINAIFKHSSIKRNWPIRIISLGELSTVNMIKSVIRDEQN